jgi:hypothetical protein
MKICFQQILGIRHWWDTLMWESPPSREHQQSASLWSAIEGSKMICETSLSSLSNIIHIEQERKVSFATVTIMTVHMWFKE